MRSDIEGLKEAELRAKLKSLARQDRLLVTEILLHLQVVEKNLYFALWGYGSISEYARIELGYSDGEAHLRVTASRAMSETPVLEKKIESGNLNLSNIAQAHR